MDADGAGNISEYKNFREGFEKIDENSNTRNEFPNKEKVGVVIASRFQNDVFKNIHYFQRIWYRKFLSLINNYIVNFIFKFNNINDTQCGFKLFSREAANKIFPYLHLMKWAYDVEILLLSRMY